MEEMISKVSAGIEKAKADIISVIDENHYSQPSQSNRLQSGMDLPAPSPESSLIINSFAADSTKASFPAF